ncbi:MAG: UDP-4-amino-4,6-dideoxy-N-acetyl-beta-L-altrosamine transaminase PseC [Idiomarinaceae bacterium HL-53]|nr:MAG: UDP-4-amino-4,6-dideoxy-N-acetyl-beta-L-altrosamine transaminase PseC [Idiomarinaceae bacterium HL-53]CUS47190.1 UDP-4-amino-4,6-dideoxy-N-acetyl-beta-L-altrosamine transaminase [Idiomarinaceae bacterium HL-53]
MIPYGRQDITQADIDAVTEVLKSDYLTQGPLVPKFEEALAAACNVPHAIAVNSATSALHIACLALNVGPGDLVWTVPNTFVASANCARYCGADIDFVDIDPATGNLCVSTLAGKLDLARQQGRLPKVLIPVHFGGASCDMASIHKLTAPHGIHIIEDASHAVGGAYQGKPVGDCRFSDLTVFSFHPVKIITTAEGGLVTTKDAALAKKLRMLRSHGITRDAEDLPADTAPWYYEQHLLGYNYRMTDMQAALGLSQLPRLASFVDTRNKLAERYQDGFCDTAIMSLHVPSDTYSAYHLFVIQVDPDIRRALFEQLRAANIGVNVHYIPVHLQPDFQALGFTAGDFPGAESYYEGAITLPLHPNLTDAEQDYIIEQVIHAVQTLQPSAL